MWGRKSGRRGKGSYTLIHTRQLYLYWRNKWTNDNNADIYSIITRCQVLFKCIMWNGNNQMTYIKAQRRQVNKVNNKVVQLGSSIVKKKSSQSKK